MTATGIILAGRALDPVEEGGEFDEPVARIEKVEVEDLLFGHTFVERKIERNRVAATVNSSPLHPGQDLAGGFGGRGAENVVVGRPNDFAFA